MGEEIAKSHFTEDDRIEFKKKLRNETKLLMDWFKEGYFESTEQGVCGLEIEAWLMDKDFLPWPKNHKFINKVNHPLIVPELSQFNFEINATPQDLNASVFTQLESEVSKLWQLCQHTAQEIGGRALMVGIPPILKEGMMSLDYMSQHQRYKALNEQVFHLRKGKELKYNIYGKDHFSEIHKDIMLEAAATSLQIHLQVNLDEAVRFYNASQIVSAPLVALCANSPFLLGKSLWNETRIPLFEQSVNISSFRDKSGEDVGRVTFGTGYARNSLFELFLENLEAYPVLLPMVTTDDEAWLHHLRLQNGTIWRWNRPIIGVSKNGKPHIRLEHRPLPSGPSIVDTVANIVLFMGLTHYYARIPEAPENRHSFEDAKKNFYKCARLGLEADIQWMGQQVNVQDLLLDQLISQAQKGLEGLDINPKEVEYYLYDIIKPRALSGRNGAQWQHSFVHLKGAKFQEMCQNYYDFQIIGRPVHKWTL